MEQAQEEIILNYFLANPDKEMAKHEVKKEVVPYMLRGSVARALRSLVRRGWLVKVEGVSTSDFGITCSTWQLNSKLYQMKVVKGERKE